MEIKIGSWNMQNFSYNSIFPKSKSAKSTKKTGKTEEICKILMQFDLIALQEIRDEKGVEYLVSKMNDYSFWVSDPICSTETTSHLKGVHKERYAFIWNNKIKCLKSPVLFNCDKSFVRSPAVGFFGIMNSQEIIFDFIISTVHIIWGKKRDREEEILKIKELMNKVHVLANAEKDIIFCGDFNTDMHGIITEPTVVNSKSHYDNFVYSKIPEIVGGGVYKFEDQALSDHYPVYINILATKDDDDITAGELQDIFSISLL